MFRAMRYVVDEAYIQTVWDNFDSNGSGFIEMADFTRLHAMLLAVSTAPRRKKANLTPHSMAYGFCHAPPRTWQQSILHSSLINHSGLGFLLG